MATTSSIAVFNPNTNLWHDIFCYSDGKIKHTGKILFDHYSTVDLALKLVSGGDLCVLTASCDQPEGHTFDNPIDGHCIYFGADICHAWVGKILFNSSKFGQDFHYWFKDGNWYCLEYQNGQTPLSKECFDTVKD